VSTSAAKAKRRRAFGNGVAVDYKVHIESRYRSGPTAGAVKMLAQMSYK